MHAVVAGAGISGIFCAAALVSRGWDVTLFERENGPCRGLSYAPGFLAWAGAEDARQFALPAPSPFPAESGFAGRLRHRDYFRAAKTAFSAERKALLSEFCAWCFELEREDAARLGLAGLEVPGFWELLSKEEAARAAELFPEARILSRSEALESEPSLSDAVPFEAALEVPSALSFNSLFLARRALKALEESEGRFRARFGTALSGLEVRDGRVRAAKTADGETVPCDAAVLANGTEALPMLASLGLSLPAAPFTGCTFTAELENEETLPARSLFFPGQPLFLTRADRRIRAYGKFALGARTESEKRAEYNRLYDGTLSSLANVRLEASSVRFWSGTADALPDGFPAAGTAAAEGLAVCAAHGARGLLFARGGAEIISACLSGTAGEIREDFVLACGPGRFAQKKN